MVIYEHKDFAPCNGFKNIQNDKYMMQSAKPVIVNRDIFSPFVFNVYLDLESIKGQK